MTTKATSPLKRCSVSELPFYLVLDANDATVKYTRANDSEVELPNDELPIMHDDTQWMELPNTAANRAAVRTFLAALEKEAEETPEAALAMLAEAHGFMAETYDTPTGEVCELTNGNRTIRITSEEVTE